MDQNSWKNVGSSYRPSMSLASVSNHSDNNLSKPKIKDMDFDFLVKKEFAPNKEDIDYDYDSFGSDSDDDRPHIQAKQSIKLLALKEKMDRNKISWQIEKHRDYVTLPTTVDLEVQHRGGGSSMKSQRDTPKRVRKGREACEISCKRKYRYHHERNIRTALDGTTLRLRLSQRMRKSAVPGRESSILSSFLALPYMDSALFEPPQSTRSGYAPSPGQALSDREIIISDIEWAQKQLRASLEGMAEHFQAHPLDVQAMLQSLQEERRLDQLRMGISMGSYSGSRASQAFWESVLMARAVRPLAQCSHDRDQYLKLKHKLEDYLARIAQATGTTSLLIDNYPDMTRPPFPYAQVALGMPLLKMAHVWENFEAVRQLAEKLVLAAPFQAWPLILEDWRYGLAHSDQAGSGESSDILRSWVQRLADEHERRIQNDLAAKALVISYAPLPQGNIVKGQGAGGEIVSLELMLELECVRVDALLEGLRFESRLGNEEKCTAIIQALVDLNLASSQSLDWPPTSPPNWSSLRGLSQASIAQVAEPFWDAEGLRVGEKFLFLINSPASQDNKEPMLPLEAWLRFGKASANLAPELGSDWFADDSISRLASVFGQDKTWDPSLSTGLGLEPQKPLTRQPEQPGVTTLTPEHPEPSLEEEGHQLVYSYVHGYRIKVDPVHTTSAAYERILTQKLHQSLPDVSSSTRAVRGVLPATVKQKEAQKGQISSEDVSTWSSLKTDELASRLQWRPLRALHVADARPREQQPERVLFGEDLRGFLERMFFDSAKRKLIMGLLTFLGVEMPRSQPSSTALDQATDRCAYERFAADLGTGFQGSSFKSPLDRVSPHTLQATRNQLIDCLGSYTGSFRAHESLLEHHRLCLLAGTPSRLDFLIRLVENIAFTYNSLSPSRAGSQEYENPRYLENNRFINDLRCLLIYLLSMALVIGQRTAEPDDCLPLVASEEIPKDRKHLDSSKRTHYSLKLCRKVLETSVPRSASAASPLETNLQVAGNLKSWTAYIEAEIRIHGVAKGFKLAHKVLCILSKEFGKSLPTNVVMQQRNKTSMVMSIIEETGLLNFYCLLVALLLDPSMSHLQTPSEDSPSTPQVEKEGRAPFSVDILMLGIHLAYSGLFILDHPNAIFKEEPGIYFLRLRGPKLEEDQLTNLALIESLFGGPQQLQQVAAMTRTILEQLLHSCLEAKKRQLEALDAKRRKYQILDKLHSRTTFAVDQLDAVHSLTEILAAFDCANGIVFRDQSASPQTPALRQTTSIYTATIANVKRLLSRAPLRFDSDNMATTKKEEEKQNQEEMVVEGESIKDVEAFRSQYPFHDALEVQLLTTLEQLHFSRLLYWVRTKVNPNAEGEDPVNRWMERQESRWFGTMSMSGLFDVSHHQHDDLFGDHLQSALSDFPTSLPLLRVVTPILSCSFPYLFIQHIRQPIEWLENTNCQRLFWGGGLTSLERLCQCSWETLLPPLWDSTASQISSLGSPSMRRFEESLDDPIVAQDPRLWSLYMSLFVPLSHLPSNPSLKRFTPQPLIAIKIFTRSLAQAITSKMHALRCLQALLPWLHQARQRSTIAAGQEDSLVAQEVLSLLESRGIQLRVQFS